MAAKDRGFQGLGIGGDSTRALNCWGLDCSVCALSNNNDHNTKDNNDNIDDYDDNPDNGNYDDNSIEDVCAL